MEPMKTVRPENDTILDEFYPGMKAYMGFWLGLFVVLGVSFFWIFETFEKDYTLMFVFSLFVCVAFTGYEFTSIKAFAVSDTGLYVFNPMLPNRKTWFAWANIELVEMEVTSKDENGKHRKLWVGFIKKGGHLFRYHLTEEEHQVFFDFMKTKNIDLGGQKY